MRPSDHRCSGCSDRTVVEHCAITDHEAAINSGRGYEGLAEYAPLASQPAKLWKGCSWVLVVGEQIGDAPKLQVEKWSPVQKLIAVESPRPIDLDLKLLGLSILACKEQWTGPGDQHESGHRPDSPAFARWIKSDRGLMAAHLGCARRRRADFACLSDHNSFISRQISDYTESDHVRDGAQLESCRMAAYGFLGAEGQGAGLVRRRYGWRWLRNRRLAATGWHLNWDSSLVPWAREPAPASAAKPFAIPNHPVPQLGQCAAPAPWRKA